MKEDINKQTKRIKHFIDLIKASNVLRVEAVQYGDPLDIEVNDFLITEDNWFTDLYLLDNMKECQPDNALLVLDLKNSHEYHKVIINIDSLDKIDVNEDGKFCLYDDDCIHVFTPMTFSETKI